ncbi:MAG: hypothetical protein ACTSVY_05400 [Candidatus Helarchaeota archaeon]
MNKRTAFIIAFISFWIVIDSIALFVIPNASTITVNGWVHRARSISFDEPTGVPDMGSLHGLTEEEAAALSTEEGYPVAGTPCGTNPGADGPWAIWSDWEDDDSFMGKELNEEEDIFYDMKSFCYFNAFFVDVPQDGEYYICFGSDDGMILFMDGTRIFEYLDGERSCFIDDDVLTKNITQGRHYFLLIVYQIRKTTGFAFRIKNATLNQTDRYDPDEAPVMMWDYKSSLTPITNTFGLTLFWISIALIFAVVIMSYYTKKRI